jgi:hypothetical protein
VSAAGIFFFFLLFFWWDMRVVELLWIGLFLGQCLRDSSVCTTQGLKKKNNYYIIANNNIEKIRCFSVMLENMQENISYQK